MSLAPAGWAESRYHPDLIGLDPLSVVHLSFAVAVGSTTPANLDRQRRSAGAVGETGITLRWIHRVRADAQVADYSDALGAGEALVSAVLAVDKLPGLSVRLLRLGPHTAIGDGTHARQDVEFAVLHLIGLEV